nr:hypothetical protein [Tanacetum cinerariifolium]GEX18469.1 hypothetical protein [Tanacetum cinerariifolium]
MTLPDIPNFASLFQFDQKVDSTMKVIIKEQVQAQVSKIMPKIKKYVTESLGAEVLVRSTNQPQTSYAVAASLSEFELKKILIDKIKENKSINRPDIQKDLYNALVKSYNSDKDIISSYGDVVTLKRGRRDQDKDEEPSTGLNRGSKRRRSGKEAESSKVPTHKESKSTCSSKDQQHHEFNIGNDDVTHVREAQDVDEHQWNPSSSPNPDCEWHKTKTVDNRPPRPWITQMAQAAGICSMSTCKSVVELENHLEEVFKATNDRLDWHNLEGKPYPHDLSKPLPLIQNERDLQVIPWDYFINNNLEYLKGGSSSRKYTTFITKTKDVDYGQVKWIEDKDDQLYKFREGDFKRLHRQDIKDMLLLLVQSKLSNLNLEERYALNVALRIFTRRIVIKERVEDLQLEVESYQKKINLTKPDTYRLDLIRMTPYTAYPDIQGIIYEDEINKNRLMRTDELHKFDDGILNHVRIALNDTATGIEMDYFPKRK